MKKICYLQYNVILFITLFLIGCVGPVPEATQPMTKSAATPQQNAQISQPLPQLGKATEPLLLKDIVTFALANNPGLHSARARWAAARNRPAQARSLDDPMVSAMPWGEMVNTRNGEMQSKFVLSQKLPWFGKLSLKGKIAQKEAAIAQETYQTKRLRLIAEVKKTYYELYWITQAIQINEENKTILKNFEEVAQTKYASGTVSQQDVLKAQVEFSRVANDLITLEELKTTTQAYLNTLLNRPPTTGLGTPAAPESNKLKTPLKQLYQKAIDYQPRLKALRQEINKSQASYGLARKQSYPDFQLMAEYSFIDNDALGSKAGDDVWSVGLGINLPLWRNKYKAAEREAEAQIRASQAEYKNSENDILFKVKDTHFKLETAARLVNLYKTSILPLAEQSLKVSETGYQTGKVDFLNLLDSQRMLLGFRLAYQRALVDYQHRLAELERLIGSEIKQDGG